MKYLHHYQTLGMQPQDVFDYFIDTIKTSIKTWDYFVNWKKVNQNLDSVKIELNLLNSLLDSNNLERDLTDLIIKYPNVICAFPFLLAVRENRLSILDDYEHLKLDTIEYDFSKRKSISAEEVKIYYDFLKNSRLIELFKNKKIKNFVDYVFGVEVGLDSNGRKNRGGSLMENIVEVFIKGLTDDNADLEYMVQATPNRIKDKWGVEIKYERSARIFDFGIFNRNTRKLYLIETNFYNGGGSKLKAVCGEFRSLFQELSKQNIEFVWVTDGQGWLTTKRPLQETFDNNNYIFNLKMLEENILSEVVGQ